VEAINARYNEFVGLASQLGGVEGAIVRIARPMTDLKVHSRFILMTYMETEFCRPSWRCCKKGLRAS